MGVDWASVSEPHTSALNVELCLYGTYVRTYIHTPRPAQWVTHIACHYFHHVCLYGPVPFCV